MGRFEIFIIFQEQNNLREGRYFVDEARHDMKEFQFLVIVHETLLHAA